MQKILLFILPMALASGCSVFEPSPAVATVQLVTVAVTGAASMAPISATDPIVHQHPAIKNVCIEFNRDVPIADLVPAIQTSLSQHGIESRVYDPGMAPNDCRVILYYSAYLQWDKRSFSSDYVSYLSFAALTLRANGEVMASASYEMNQMALDKWQSTRSKIAPVVEAIIGSR